MSDHNEAGSFSRPVLSFERRITGIIRALHYVGMGFVVLMMGMTIVHAVGRYGFARPLPGLVEISGFMLIMIIFFTGAYTEVEKGHTTIRIFLDRFSRRTQLLIDIFVHLFCLAITILACWQTVVRSIFILDTGYVSTLLGIPHYLFYLIVALGWLLIGAAIMLHLLRFLYQAVGRAEQ